MTPGFAFNQVAGHKNSAANTYIDIRLYIITNQMFSPTQWLIIMIFYTDESNMLTETAASHQ